MSHRFTLQSLIAINPMQKPIPPLTPPGRQIKHRQSASLALWLGSALFIASNGACAGSEPAPGLNSVSMVDFQQESASSEVRYVAGWIMDSGDNRGMPFAIIDKVNAKVFVFDTGGNLQGAAPALLGMARGDDSVPGIGERKLSTIRPEERSTPAGRFVSSLSSDVSGKQILVIDYAASLSLHPLAKGTPAERRAQRLESATSEDNRISYGCINVPVKFYQKVITPAFTKTNGLVYILPETSKASDMFGSSSLGAGGSR